MKNRIKTWPEVLKVAWPLVIANSFWNVQLTIDRVLIGNYSTESLAAAMAVFGTFWVPMALLQQTAAYVSTFVAQYYGANRPERVGPAVWQSFYVSVLGGLLMLLLIPCTPALFGFMGHSENLIPLEISYFSAICFSGMPAALMAAVSGYFTGLGRTWVIMWINAMGMLGNVLFDYLLIFGNHGFPELGIAGAGYATAVANWMGALFGIWLMLRKHETKFGFAKWQWDRELMRRFLKYGVPSGLQWALEGLAFAVFLIFVGRMENGDAALAASGIAVTIMLLAILPPLGVGQAVAVLVGQHLGANQPESAERKTFIGLEISVLFIVCVGSTFPIFPDFYLNWFANPTNTPLWNQVSELVPILLMYVATFTLFDSMNIVYSFALRGAGDTRFVTAVALLVPWPVMNLPTWLTSTHPNAIYWAWASASAFIIVQALIFRGRFLGGKWKSMRVIEAH